MSQKVNKRVVLNSYVGRGNQPSTSNFTIEEIEYPSINDGEILVQTLYLSVDPYHRGRMNPVKTYIDPFELNKPLTGTGVGRVVESKNPKYSVGDLLVSVKQLNWPYQSYVVFDEEKAAVYNKFDYSKIPESLIPATIGWLGMPGLTAYFGLEDKAKPKEGETLVVSGAAGACGSVAGQIGKMANLRVVGIVGSKEKEDYIVNELGFDAAVNYKGKTKEQIKEELSKLCPNGVDIYYDNVGGEISESVLILMNQNGRVPICGQISQYNKEQPDPLSPEVQQHLEKNNVQRGWFMYMNYSDKFDAAWSKLIQWAQEGLLKCRDTTYDGIEKLPSAFVGLFAGENVGKAVVKTH
eukprot:TRINITY_DN10539_c0_g1_i1.p1 TRINITY_DN10539_c0_g1~~TRINITY_DN10539_c0_g1_i1.p1  ORF type:complete len:352 (+),score=58.36 TRINITY_DN10539_c0_g1_i1:35-1090(+)